jgi:hypothetical protein
MGKRVDISEVRRVVGEYRKTGLSVAKYCEASGFSISRLRWFIRRLKKSNKRNEPVKKSFFTKIPIYQAADEQSITVHYHGVQIKIPEKENKYFINKK